MRKARRQIRCRSRIELPKCALYRGDIHIINPKPAQIVNPRGICGACVEEPAHLIGTILEIQRFVSMPDQHPHTCKRGNPIPDVFFGQHRIIQRGDIVQPSECRAVIRRDVVIWVVMIHDPYQHHRQQENCANGDTGEHHRQRGFCHTARRMSR